MTLALNSVILGAVAMASLVASMFFLRFWQRTGDRFFLLFAAAFLIDAISRAALGVSRSANEEELWCYVGRLLTFTLILVAIIDKNRKRDG